MIRMTKQKRQLLEIIQEYSGFFTADQLSQKTSVSLATIYRFLQKMEQQGELHSVLCEQTRLYSKEKRNHIHFTCEVCGKIHHKTLKKANFLQEVDEDVCHFQLELFGTCKKCKKK